jgi:alpha-1,2-mannosyltransferase
MNLAATNPRSPLARVWGVRMFADGRFNRRVQVLILILVIAYYLLWSVSQLLVITPLDFQHDFIDYYRAANYVAHGQGVYTDFDQFWGTEHWAIAYIYPPLFAVTLIPIAALPLALAGRLWILLIHGAFLASLLVLFAVQPRLSRTAKVTIAVLFYLFLPLYLTLKFQQVAALWLLLLLAVLWAYQRRRPFWVGVFYALAASLKVIPVLLILFFLRKREFRISAWCLGILAAITAGELLLVSDAIGYATRVLPTIGLGTSSRDNASVNGLLSRVIEIFPQATGPLPAKLVVNALVLAAIGVFLAFTLKAIVPGASTPEHRQLEFALFISVLPIISSVSWQHHLVTLLLPIGLLLGHFYRQRTPPWRQLGVLAAAYLLLWVDWRLFGLSEPDPHGWYGAVVLAATSFRLMGMLLLWGLLLRVVREARQAETRPVALRPAA